MGPRAALTKALFDGDDSAWDDFNPKKLLEDPAPKAPKNTAQPQIPPANQQANHPPKPQQQPQQQPLPGQYNNPPQNPNNNNQGYAGGGFSWADIT